MKKLISVALLMILVCGLCFALDFSAVDSLYDKGTDYKKVYDDLQSMLPKAATNQEKASVYWRLARVCVDLGDALSKKDSKGRLAVFSEGEAYGQKAIELNPTKESYQWHCSCIGRWGQTKGVLSSLAKVDPMLSDLKNITDTLGVTDYSEAWYVIAVLFHSVPSKSNSEAVSYARIAVDTIPSDKMYLGTYQELAEVLYDRNWSTSKRKTELAKIQKEWEKGASGNMEKYKSYEGKYGVNGTAPWLKGKMGEVSDREEASLILDYAMSIYNKTKTRTPSDERNYSELQEVKARFK